MCVLYRDRRVNRESRFNYADFVWFLISEEDKRTETRCPDLPSYMPAMLKAH